MKVIILIPLVLAVASVALVQCSSVPAVVARPSQEQTQCVKEAAENRFDTVREHCGLSGNGTIKKHHPGDGHGDEVHICITILWIIKIDIHKKTETIDTAGTRIKEKSAAAESAAAETAVSF